MNDTIHSEGEMAEKNISEPVSVLKLITEDREKHKSNRADPLKTVKKLNHYTLRS